MSMTLENQKNSSESPLFNKYYPFGIDIFRQIDHFKVDKWITPKGLQGEEEIQRKQLESTIVINYPKEEEGVFQTPKEVIQESPALPQLLWETRNHPLLTFQICGLLERLWTIISSRALQLRFSIKEAKVLIFTDPEEEETKAILQLTCDTNILQALAFWDSLEPDLQNLLKVLSDFERTIFLTKIGLRIYWLR